MAKGLSPAASHWTCGPCPLFETSRQASILGDLRVKNPRKAAREAVERLTKAFPVKKSGK